MLEYAPGGSLRDVLRREGRLSQAETTAILARAATAARGSVVTYESVGTPFISQNSDSCGSYFEIQATGASTPAIAVGMSVRFAATGRTVVFAADRGAAPTVVKNC